MEILMTISITMILLFISIILSVSIIPSNDAAVLLTVIIIIISVLVIISIGKSTYYIIQPKNIVISEIIDKGNYNIIKQNKGTQFITTKSFNVGDTLILGKKYE